MQAERIILKYNALEITVLNHISSFVATYKYT